MALDVETNAREIAEGGELRCTRCGRVDADCRCDTDGMFGVTLQVSERALAEIRWREEAAAQTALTAQPIVFR